jgi:cytochrome bd-type quinol oxidase subunit 2
MKPFLTSRRAIFTGLGLGALAVLVLAHPGSAHAAIVPQGDATQFTKDDVIKIIVNIIQWALAFVSAIAAIFIVVNGYQYIFSAGNPEKIEKAKMGVTWSIGGFILAVSSYAIVLLLARALKYNNIDAITNRHPNGTPADVGGVLDSLANILFIFGGAVAVLFIVLGGYRYITSQGERDAVESAKKTLTYAVIGLILVFASFAIFNFIATRLNVNGF